MIRKYFKEAKIFVEQYFLEIVIFLFAILPVFFTWGRLSIGGDVLIPFNSEGLEKYLYQWIDLKNGQYFSVNYYVFYLIYRFFEIFTDNIYLYSSTLLFFLTLIAGFGIYKLAALFSVKRNKITLLVPIVFYLFSPALLNAYHYIFIYSFSPWFIYFVFKSIKRKEISILDMLWINLVFAFCSLDLPNPKYLFHLFLISGTIYFVSWALRKITIRDLRRVIVKFSLSFFLSAYLLLPLANFTLNYDPIDYGVRVKSGYKDTGKMMNYGDDTMDRVFRLHQDSIFLNHLDSIEYTSSILISILSYFFIFVILARLLIIHSEDNVDKKDEIVVWVLLLVYLFFAAGPNRPFGLAYEFFVSKVSLLAFLRTTAGAVFFLSIFYALSLFFYVEQIKRFKVFMSLLIIGVTMYVGYPYITGEYYKNFNSINQYTDIQKHGYGIPDEYHQAREFIDYQKIIARTFYPNTDLTYINTTWGFFGPIIYNFLYTNYNLGYDKVLGSLSNHNVGFVFVDSSLMNKITYYVKNTVPAWKENFIEILYVDKSEFLPRLYTAKSIGTFDDVVLSQMKIDFSQERRSERKISFAKNELNSTLRGMNLDTDVVLEYKEINPTKYRVKVHGARNQFILVLSEQFHKDWNVYLSSKDQWEKDTTNELSQKIDRYAGFEKNEYFQIEKEGLEEYIQKGWITTLGDGTERTIEHRTWDGHQEKVSSIEKYSIDFISKNFYNTIQNNNLQNGYFWETWGREPVDILDKNLLVNGYANAWVINTGKVCGETFEKCVRNDKGGYEFELIVEFWPQRVSYIGIILSGFALLYCVVALTISPQKRRKSKNVDVVIE